MQSELTSICLLQKLDLPRHEIPIGQASGTWVHSAIEFDYFGHHYTATTLQDIGVVTQPCTVNIHKYGITVVVDLPPRKRYFDDEGDPQYQPPQDLWEAWNGYARSVFLENVRTIGVGFVPTECLVMKALRAYMTGQPVAHGARNVVHDLIEDFDRRGFLLSEFPLLFMDITQ